MYQTPLSLKQVLTTPLNPVKWPGLLPDLDVWIKRDDLTHPVIQGNKWHKLRLNLLAAQANNDQGILTFGGAHSNHIAACAAACKDYGLQSSAVIRGDELANQPQLWSPTLTDAYALGMRFKFVSRTQYRQRQDADWLASLIKDYPGYYFIPEGGSNALAVTGMAEVINQINIQCPGWTHLLTAVGTGASLAGLAKAAPNKQVWGIAALKNAHYLKANIKTWIGQDQTNWHLLSGWGNDDFHAGGYAKTTPAITAVQTRFEQANNLLLDPIYTAKLVYAFNSLVVQGAFPSYSRIVIYHSGGLQGREAAMKDLTKYK